MWVFWGHQTQCNQRETNSKFFRQIIQFFRENLHGRFRSPQSCFCEHAMRIIPLPRCLYVVRRSPELNFLQYVSVIVFFLIICPEKHFMAKKSGYCLEISSTPFVCYVTNQEGQFGTTNLLFSYTVESWVACIHNHCMKSSLWHVNPSMISPDSLITQSHSLN